jgi:hypothetical protein
MAESFQNEVPKARVNIKLDLHTGGALLKYEPRLKSIEIAAAEPAGDMLLSFTMSCESQQLGLVRYGTHLIPDGQTRLTTHEANTRD